MKKFAAVLGLALVCASVGKLAPVGADVPNVTATGNIWGLNQKVSAQNLFNAGYCTVLVSAGYTGSLTYLVTDGAGSVYPDPYAPSSVVTPAASPQAVLLKIPSVSTSMTVQSTKYTSGGAAVSIVCSAAPPGPYASSSPAVLATPTATPT